MNLKTALKFVIFFSVCGMLGVVCVQANVGNQEAIMEYKNNFRFSWNMFWVYASVLLASMITHSYTGKGKSNGKK